MASVLAVPISVNLLGMDVQISSSVKCRSNHLFTQCGHAYIRAGLCQALDKNKLLEYPIKQLARSKARMPAKLEHPLRALQQQFAYVKGCYREINMSKAQLITLLVLCNPWIARPIC